MDERERRNGVIENRATALPGDFISMTRWLALASDEEFRERFKNKESELRAYLGAWTGARPIDVISSLVPDPEEEYPEPIPAMTRDMARRWLESNS